MFCGDRTHLVDVIKGMVCVIFIRASHSKFVDIGHYFARVAHEFHHDVIITHCRRSRTKRSCSRESSKRQIMYFYWSIVPWKLLVEFEKDHQLDGSKHRYDSEKLYESLLEEKEIFYANSKLQKRVPLMLCHVLKLIILSDSVLALQSFTQTLSSCKLSLTHLVNLVKFLT